MKKLLLSVIFVLVVFAGVLFWQMKSAGQSSKALVTEAFAKALIEVGGDKPWDITVHNEAFYAEVAGKGSLGLGETYMAEMWDCPAIDQFIYRLLIAKVDRPTWKMAWRVLKAKIFNMQNRASAKNVIDVHYNLGNDLYQKMLGSTMAYSCGYWKDAKTLDEAQNGKYDLICRKLGLEKGMTLLDIGCGFGGLAKFAAEHYGVKVTGITLSENQAAFAKKFCEGLPVEIWIQDYRDLVGQFDRIVSVGMFEHVGPKNYREFMEISDRCLKKGGLFLLHTIGGNISTHSGDPWISTYIFPGGVLPSIAQIGKASEGIFVMEDWHNFGIDYAKTLMAWHANFLANWDSLSKEYSLTFYRMWNYYLLNCVAVFEARECQLWQVVFSKDLFDPQYESVR